jgi:hypothetical protein
MSTIHAPDFYEPRKKWRTKKRDEFLRENVGIDPPFLQMGWACPSALSSATSANLAFAPSQATRLGRECGAMLLLSKPTSRCAECDAPAKIQALFTREVYCGRYCLTEGQLKYVRWVLRANAEAQHVGQ